MKSIIVLSFLFAFIQCKTSRFSNDIVPYEFQFPDDSIGNGKKFIFHKNGSVETSSSELHLINENKLSFRTVKNKESGVAIDSSKFDNGKIVEMYTFYMSGDGSPTKAIIQNDTLIKNGSKYGIRHTSFKFDTEYNTYTSKNEQYYVKDTSIYSMGKEVPCIVILSKTNLEMRPKEGVDANRPYKYSSYGYLYYGKGIGLIRNTQQFKDRCDSWDLIKIKNVN
jgi:hypothetical protein